MVKGVILLNTLFFISSCGQKETADYHYQQGVDFFAASKYEEAKTEFETVIEKYPLSPLVTYAKQQLVKVESELTKMEAEKLAEEKRRQEEEKYSPRSPQEAIDEWREFRNNEKAYKGTVTTWRFQVEFISYENPVGYLDRAAGGYGSMYAVAILGPKSFTYQASAFLGDMPVVKQRDWIVVTGKFQYVSSDNVIALSPIHVKNEGFR